MSKRFVDCFMLMGTVLSLKGGEKLPEMGRPLIQDVFTTTVNVSLSIQDFRITNEKYMEGTLEGILNQKWVDPRLGANDRTRKLAVSGQIWKPKITNIIGQNDQCNNEDTVFWRGFGDEGNVLLSEKIRVKAQCTTNFRKFPFDIQYCQFKFGSYRFPAEEVTIIWDKNSIEVFQREESTTFDIKNVRTFVEIDIRLAGNFSVAVVQLAIQRQYLHYVICIIIPTMILIILNYATLWIDLNQRSTKYKINLCMLAGLLYNFYTSTCNTTQLVPYLKSLDIFVGVSASFSVITLLEAFVIDKICKEEEQLYHLKKNASVKEYPKIVYWTEFFWKVFYPVLYCFFLIVYGIVYVR